MAEIEYFDASYQDIGVTRYRGNPFIEALPAPDESKLDTLTKLAHYPDEPTELILGKNEILRSLELQTLQDVVYPFPEYETVATSLFIMIRESYVSRNPLKAEDTQRRMAIATMGHHSYRFPSNWKTSAKGHMLIAVSGMGKTTLVRTYLLGYPQVIRHTQYKGTALNKGTALTCFQIVHLTLRIPHDGTIRSLCLQFFKEIDRILGTNYSAKAKSIPQIAPMVQEMANVASAVSLGFIVVDEVQNLRNTTTKGAEAILNLFSEIIERLGISLLVIATPAVQSIYENNVRNTRKLSSFGYTTIPPMRKNSEQWKDFCDTYWKYSYVRNQTTLKKPILDAWWDASAGNTAFAAMAFMFAQQHAIGGREVVDELAFERASKVSMAVLQPALAALKSGKAAQLQKFDDLIFNAGFREIRNMLGIQSEAEDEPVKEFLDVEDEARRSKETVNIRNSEDETTGFINCDDDLIPVTDPSIR